ncbi:MT-A70-domain-containing protein [Microdochium bolleyi]|uniref:MT-A70-domain-containing protein n=1 Tax=Microdochium bolleyi TaxID=196109 RepID=A0A136J597_9PEZI|nr:MT-A70-domain-containing protein [Microdochium bolleyi]
MTTPPAAGQQQQAESILYTAPDESVVVVDIPRSVEEAQVLTGQRLRPQRVLSSEAPSTPWMLPEPRGAAGVDSNIAAVSPAAAIAELMTLESVSAALETTQLAYRSRRIVGTIQATRDDFLQDAPVFDLILLDPPWPSRSVKRKRRTGSSYATVSSIPEARTLLASIPVAAKLNKDHGLVAVWITNKAAVYDLLVAPGTGIFANWGVELVGEYIWLKITDGGEPIFALDSQWRKPWERLLLARPIQRAGPVRRESSGGIEAAPQKRAIPTKVILAVPDLHSRKPNLRSVLQDLLPPDYLGLEVFARNLTAGWWSWGNEALLFQQPEHWVEVEAESHRRTRAENDADSGRDGQSSKSSHDR